MVGYQYNGSAEVRLKLVMLGDVSSLSLMSVEMVVTPLILDCQADHTRHIFRCGSDTSDNQGQDWIEKLIIINISNGGLYRRFTT